VVTCIPHMFPRDAAPGNYKIVAAMPDRDGDHIYRIKSPLEEYERVVAENLLVRSRGYLPEEELSPGIDNAAKGDNCLVAAAGRRACSWSVAQRGSNSQNQIERNLLPVKVRHSRQRCLSGRLRSAEADAIEGGKAIPLYWAPHRLIFGLLTVLRGSRRGGYVQRT
jgi:hypothetical protein